MTTGEDQWERFAAFLFYVEDWLSSTAIDLMSAGEERGYLRLLLHMWKRPDCGLPNDDRVLAHLSKLGKQWHGKSGAVVRAEFFERDGRLYNERLLRERENQERIRRGKHLGGINGAKARWGHRQSQVVEDECHVKGLLPDVLPTGARMPQSGCSQAEADEKKRGTDGNANDIARADAMTGTMAEGSLEDASSSSSSKVTTKACASGDARPSDSPTRERAPMLIDGLTVEQESWFSDWWAAYWLHKAKKAARRAFAKQVRAEARFQEVMAAMEKQKPEMMSRQPQHRPHGATWLNGERWTDEEPRLGAAEPASSSPAYYRDFED